MLTRKEAIACYALRVWYGFGREMTQIRLDDFADDNTMKLIARYFRSLTRKEILKRLDAKVCGPNVWEIDGEKLEQSWLEWWNANPSVEVSAFSLEDLA